MHSAQCIMHIVLGVNTDQCIPNPHPHCCKIYCVTLLHIVDRCNVSCIMHLAALHCCASSKNVPSDLCIFTVHLLLQWCASSHCIFLYVHPFPGRSSQCITRWCVSSSPVMCIFTVHLYSASSSMCILTVSASLQCIFLYVHHFPGRWNVSAGRHKQKPPSKQRTWGGGWRWRWWGWRSWRSWWWSLSSSLRLCWKWCWKRFIEDDGNDDGDDDDDDDDNDDDDDDDDDNDDATTMMTTTMMMTGWWCAVECGGADTANPPPV